jgi:hypothetical protein
MQCEPNPFKQKLYDEFEQNSFKVLGVPGDRVREVLGARGENINADFEAAWEYGGASYMRVSMSMVLATLELVYYQTEIDCELTEDERVQRYESFEIGLNKKIIDAWYDKRYEQLKAADDGKQVS